MVLAPIMGQTLLDVLDGGLATSSIGAVPLLAGFISAFVVGCLACRYMIDIVKRGKLIYFAIYCAIVGCLAIGSYIF